MRRCLQGRALGSLRYSVSKLNCAKPTRRHTPSLNPSTDPECRDVIYIVAKESSFTSEDLTPFKLQVFLLGRLKDKTSFPSPLGVAEPVTMLMSLCVKKIPRAMFGAIPAHTA